MQSSDVKNALAQTYLTVYGTLYSQNCNSILIVHEETVGACRREQNVYEEKQKIYTWVRKQVRTECWAKVEQSAERR
jgi:hypothetical protein